MGVSVLLHGNLLTSFLHVDGSWEVRSSVHVDVSHEYRTVLLHLHMTLQWHPVSSSLRFWVLLCVRDPPDLVCWTVL